MNSQVLEREKADVWMDRAIQEARTGGSIDDIMDHFPAYWRCGDIGTAYYLAKHWQAVFGPKPERTESHNTDTYRWLDWFYPVAWVVLGLTFVLFIAFCLTGG